MSAGYDLRKLREDMGLTTRAVENASAALARKYRNHKYVVPISRLCDFENKGTIPSVYRLYSLAVIYRCNLNHLLCLYGVGVDTCEPRTDSSTADVPRRPSCFPITQDIAIDSRKTCYLGQTNANMREGFLFAYLQEFASSGSSYGYIGSDDWTMYPLLPPSTLVQIDESCNRISSGGWTSEYERPIYFLEMPGKHVCCWCTASRDEIILMPHPLSPVPPSIVQHQDAEVLGQVIGAALILGRQRDAAGSRSRVTRLLHIAH